MPHKGRLRGCSGYLESEVMKKDFNRWNEKKQELDADPKAPLFKEGQVWWCSIGVNVGFEIFGKSEVFTRPVLILRKYNNQTFFGLPMTSKRKDHPSCYAFDFQEEKGSIILNQGRTLDAKRLADLMGELPESTFQKVRQAFKNFH